MYSLSPSMCFTAFAPGTTGPSTAVVTNTLLPQTIGDECERPSIGVFHLMFLVGLHSDGRFFSFEIPEPSGPRHCGQFPAEALLNIKLSAANEIVSVNAIPRDSFTVVVPLLDFSAQLPDLLFAAGASPKANRCEIVRTITRPSEMAGVAIITSPTGFFASSSYFGPA